MICKKTIDILKQRKKEKKLEEKRQTQLDKEVRIAFNEKLCPYCGNEIKYSFLNGLVCRICKKEFRRVWLSDTNFKGVIEDLKK